MNRVSRAVAECRVHPIESAQTACQMGRKAHRNSAFNHAADPQSNPRLARYLVNRLSANDSRFGQFDVQYVGGLAVRESLHASSTDLHSRGNERVSSLAEFEEFWERVTSNRLQRRDPPKCLPSECREIRGF